MYFALIFYNKLVEYPSRVRNLLDIALYWWYSIQIDKL